MVLYMPLDWELLSRFAFRRPASVCTVCDTLVTPYPLVTQCVTKFKNILFEFEIYNGKQLSKQTYPDRTGYGWQCN